MENQNEHFRHILLYYFRKGKNATQAHRKLCAVYGNDALKERQCRNWFAKFRSGDFSLQDEHRSGRPVKVDDDKIKAILDSDPHSTTQEIANELKISHSSVENHLKQLGYVNKLDVWVPHELTEIHRTKRINVCDSLLKRNEYDPFLKRMITGDEKWIVYDNVERKRSWLQPGEPTPTTSKAEIHQKKVMLSVWWDFKGIIYFELLEKNKTINSQVYCQQLTKLNEALQQKRPDLVNRKGVVFHHDNARPHTSLETRQKLLEFGWEVLSHPPYSPDLAPSDYYLFRSLQNSLRGKKFTSNEDIKEYLNQYFAQKDKKFFELGIMALTERWRKVVEQKGKYITE